MEVTEKKPAEQRLKSYETPKLQTFGSLSRLTHAGPSMWQEGRLMLAVMLKA